MEKTLHIEFDIHQFVIEKQEEAQRFFKSGDIDNMSGWLMYLDDVITDAVTKAVKAERAIANRRKVLHSKKNKQNGLCEICGLPVSEENKSLCPKHRQHRIEYMKEWKVKAKNRIGFPYRFEDIE